MHRSVILTLLWEPWWNFQGKHIAKVWILKKLRKILFSVHLYFVDKKRLFTSFDVIQMQLKIFINFARSFIVNWCIIQTFEQVTQEQQLKRQRLVEEKKGDLKN